MKKVVPSLGFSYKDVEYDKNGWADASKFLPQDYDLCLLVVEGKSRHATGWIVDGSWFGRRVNNEDKVLFWKRVKE